MYQYFNAHPKNLKVGDCVKRALTIATGEDYMEIQRQLNKIKKEIGAKSYSDNCVWKKFIQDKKWKELSFPAVKGEDRMNGESFCKKFKNGTYILRMAHHLTVCKGGTIYDTWDCSRKCVYKAWIIE